MNKSYLKLLVVGVLAIGVLGIFALQNQSNAMNPNSKSNSNILAQNNSDNSLPVNLSTYIDYSSGTQYLNKRNVLFFKANWCSSCGVADDNLSKSIASIPEDLTIYKVDFEKEQALRSKYGVTLQHTFVQVDNNGNKLKQWAGSYTIDEILKQMV